MTFAATILTLYPEMFPGPLGVSLAGRALERGDWSCETVQIRDFATDKHRTVDDTPAGGGAGMVLKADVLAAALNSITPAHPELVEGLPLSSDQAPQEKGGPSTSSGRTGREKEPYSSTGSTTHNTASTCTCPPVEASSPVTVPSNGAVSACSIFIASSTIRRWPALT